MLKDKQLINKVPFQSTKDERKNCVWTASKLSEMCIVQHVEMKSVFTFQPIKRLVSTTVKVQSLLQRFENSFEGPKIENFVVWR